MANFAARLFLNGLNRTFIGSTGTYGVDQNPQGLFIPVEYQRQEQHWHFTGTGEPTKDPVIAVYTNDSTAADDLKTEGSH